MENNICDDLHLDHDQIGIGIGIGIGILLPQDVLIQILVLLPVISLLRFKSVCKSWRALIQSSLFIHLHLNTTNTNTLRPSNNNFGTFIFQTFKCSIESTKNEAFMLTGGSCRGGGGGGGEKDDDDDDLEELKIEYLGFPPHCKLSPGLGNPEIFMVGSCNGLICIHDITKREVSLWNPATRQFRILPKSLTLEGIPGDFLDYDFAAFGYDVKTKDYKVLQISQFIPHTMRNINRILSVKEFIFRVQVYSLNTDSWRFLEGIDSFPAFPQQHGSGLNHGVYLNGSYYFLGYAVETVQPVTPGYMLFSFDFTKEIFTTMQRPHGYHSKTILTCFGEKLALFEHMVVKKDESNVEFCDIWVLNEYGVKEEESWTNLHLNVPYSSGFGTPRGISNSGEFALLTTYGGSRVNGVYVLTCEQLQLLNLVTKEIKKEFITGDQVLRFDVYKQSLVSIGGNDTVADRVIGGTM